MDCYPIYSYKVLQDIRLSQCTVVWPTPLSAPLEFPKSNRKRKTTHQCRRLRSSSREDSLILPIRAKATQHTGSGGSKQQREICKGPEQKQETFAMLPVALQSQKKKARNGTTFSKVTEHFRNTNDSPRGRGPASLSSNLTTVAIASARARFHALRGPEPSLEHGSEDLPDGRKTRA